MPEATDRKPPVSFWLISIALLLWGLGGASIYVAYFVETPEEFAQTAEAEQAIVDYAAAYLESPEGVVPYRQWPEGVKGHFIVRIPPAGQIAG